MKNIGLYIHIPFCSTKCSYCDFYSLINSEHLMDDYVTCLINEISLYKNKELTVNTVYFGGGTPTLLGEKRLVKLLSNICEAFGKATEITIEANPNTITLELLKNLKGAGVNRLSIGMQSSVGSELDFLGRTHTASDVKSAVYMAKSLGIDNISIDLILGLEHQTIENVKTTIDYCILLQLQHISMYILKVEPSTPLAKQRLQLPNDDYLCDMYLEACKYLEINGYKQYEISNFCLEGYECKHNLKYWQGEDYIGIGVAAHSCFEGKRYYHERDIEAYINGAKPIIDGESGGLEEYLMLNLRLNAGIDLNYVQNTFLIDKKIIINKISNLLDSNLIKLNNDNLSLTQEGFLISNQIIYRIIN